MLISAPITSSGMANALKRARQLTDVKWTPLLGTIPGTRLVDGERTYYYFEKGKEQTGIPYSSVYETNTYVGYNVSLETFISATCNPKSYLYTRNLRNECVEKKAVSYYGMVCSKFVLYVLEVPESYTTTFIPSVPGLKKIFNVGELDPYRFNRCDVLLHPKRHTVMVTDVLSDENGKIQFIEVSEETSNPQMQRKLWSEKEFFEHFAEYELYRYEYLDSITYEKSDFVNVFDEKQSLADRKYDVLTKYGDKANIPLEKNEIVEFDILTDGWEKANVYKDGQSVFETDIKGKDSFSFYPNEEGFYSAFLIRGNERSKPCKFCIIDTSVNVSFDEGILSVTGNTKCGNIKWILLGERGDCNFVRATGKDVKTDLSRFSINGNDLAVAIQNEYGITVNDKLKIK